MAEPTLQQIFGEHATQTATTLTIAKSDLAITGLTASATNTAESLMSAIILLASKYLNEENQQTNADIQITIAPGFDTLVNRNNQTYRQRSYTVEFQKVDTTSTIDPNDY
ncbi:hypothetical protein BZZ01_32740 (plasmid) [Nostocales cyanobacterium HT-58-2]|nr:hypothetical protein BZZ01_32740 [Nostocales cyanobacterium HT-58-2]